MSISLQEKQAFFEQLDAWRNCDDETDALSTEEEALRQQSKAFYAAARISAAPQPFLNPNIAGLHHRRTASAPALPEPVDDELEIIAVTPRNHRPVSAQALGISLGDSVILATENPPRDRPIQRGAQQTARLLRSRSDRDEPSPSVTMKKRKRAQSLQMAPEADQLFKGLFFFYLPNDDINPARRLKITKAREHGATWTRDLADATHIIVDKSLQHDAIKSILDSTSLSSSIVLVNDLYPIECLKRGILFDPNPTVEKYQFKVLGDPGSAQETVQRSFSQDSSTSLQIKPRKDNHTTVTNTPDSTQRSNDLIPSSYPEVVLPPEKAISKDISQSTRRQSLRAHSKPCSLNEEKKAVASNDELTTCIDAVLDDPEKHEYLDDSDGKDSGSDKEAPSKRKKTRKGRLRSRNNNSGTDFFQDRFMCMHGGTREKKTSGPNADTIKLLEEMADEHNLSNETWRVQSYRKAVATLRRQPTRIKTAKEAAALPNIGSSLAEHIEEIVSTGRFGKLDQARNEPSRQALRLFCDIYGVGISTARKWVELGYRTLDDLRSKAKLTPNQKVGLNHYDDLLTRIPRAEVKALGDHVKDVAAAIDPATELIIGGSYRRGAEASGDVDLLVTRPGTSSPRDLVPFLDKLVDTLTRAGFLTAALASHQHHRGQGGASEDDDSSNKWHGCCVLPQTAFPGDPTNWRPIWRRIDFLIVPHTELGAALVYFTGNDLFNRSLRLLARKRNMKLNHRALTGPDGVHEGRDERRIFAILGVQWREPHERWC